MAQTQENKYITSDTTLSPIVSYRKVLGDTAIRIREDALSVAVALDFLAKDCYDERRPTIEVLQSVIQDIQIKFKLLDGDATDLLAVVRMLRKLEEEKPPV